jgi:hypothetical protein
MTLAIVGTPVELNETSTVTTRTITVPTVLLGDIALLFIGSSLGNSTFLLTDNGLADAMTAVASEATGTGNTSQVFYNANLAAADSGKIITIKSQVGGVDTGTKVSAALVILRDGATSSVIGGSAKKTFTSTQNPTTPTAVSTVAGGTAFFFVSMARGSVTPNITTLPAQGGQGLTDDAFMATGVTSSLNVGAVAHDSTLTYNNGDTVAAKTFNADVSALGSAWTVIIKPGNISPIVSAGADTSTPVTVGKVLGGSATDLDGTISSTVWTVTTKPTGSTPGLTGSTTLTPTFTPDLPGMYVLTLTVTDNSSLVTTDTVTVWATTTSARLVEDTGDDGAWTPDGGATIRAVTSDASDLTWAESGDDPSADTLTRALDPMPHGPKEFTYRIGMESASPTGNYLLTLKQGGTTISTKNHTGVTDSILAGTWTLTPAENATITNPYQLTVSVSASVSV